MPRLIFTVLTDVNYNQFGVDLLLCLQVLNCDLLYTCLGVVDHRHEQRGRRNVELWGSDLMHLLVMMMYMMILVVFLMLSSLHKEHGEAGQACFL